MATISSSSESVTDVVWPWRSPAASFHRPAILRVVLMCCIPFAVAAIVYTQTSYKHRELIAMVATTAGSLQLLLGLFLPKAYVKVEGALFLIVHLVGFLLSWLLLVPLYLTFFVIAHLGLRLQGKDLMHRKPDPKAETYWISREPVSDPAKHYRRQY
jgi:hypothetical protein